MGSSPGWSPRAAGRLGIVGVVHPRGRPLVQHHFELGAQQRREQRPDLAHHLPILRLHVKAAAPTPIAIVGEGAVRIQPGQNAVAHRDQVGWIQFTRRRGQHGFGLDPVLLRHGRGQPPHRLGDHGHVFGADGAVGHCRGAVGQRRIQLRAGHRGESSDPGGRDLATAGFAVAEPYPAGVEGMNRHEACGGLHPSFGDLQIQRGIEDFAAPPGLLPQFQHIEQVGLRLPRQIRGTQVQFGRVVHGQQLSHGQTCEGLRESGVLERSAIFFEAVHHAPPPRLSGMNLSHAYDNSGGR